MFCVLGPSGQGFWGPSKEMIRNLKWNMRAHIGIILGKLRRGTTSVRPLNRRARPKSEMYESYDQLMPGPTAPAVEIPHRNPVSLSIYPLSLSLSICMCVYMYICMSTCIFMCVCTYVRTYKCMYVIMYVCVHIHIYTYYHPILLFWFEQGFWGLSVSALGFGKLEDWNSQTIHLPGCTLAAGQARRLLYHRVDRSLCLGTPATLKPPPVGSIGAYLGAMERPVGPIGAYWSWGWRSLLYRGLLATL